MPNSGDTKKIEFSFKNVLHRSKYKMKWANIGSHLSGVEEEIYRAKEEVSASVHLTSILIWEKADCIVIPQ